MESTIIRTLDTTAMVVGPGGPATEKIASGFEQYRVRVVRVAHAAAACERLAVSMPQVVVVIGTLRPDERDALADRATAVGALVLYVDPALDDETLTEIIGRAAQAAMDRKTSREKSVLGASEPPGVDVEIDVELEPVEAPDDVDSGWDGQ